MPTFLDTSGLSTFGIGICDRCKRKVSLTELRADGNSPGLRVCDDGCWDPIDPWRLAPRPPDRITLDHPRPDTQLFPFEPIPVYANQIGNVTQMLPTVTWSAITVYPIGASVTPQNVNDPAVILPQMQFIALNAGTSGTSVPAWPLNAGVPVVDGSVTWLCVGVALMDGITQQQPLYP